MRVINIINSIIGKKGNIGLRASYIIKELRNNNIDNFSFSRGVVNEFTENNRSLGFLGNLPRLLNAYRIYVNKNFNNRVYDIKLFNLFIRFMFKNSARSFDVCHLWETSPNIIKIVKKSNSKVILDIPIAPTEYAVSLFSLYDDNLSINYDYNIKVEKESFELADAIISPSNFVTEKLIDLNISESKIYTIPFGVDLNTTSNKKFKKDYTKGIDFCFAGTINKRKGIEFLLRAWDDKSFENDRLHLCGRLYPEIEDLLNKYNFKNIVLPGFVNTSEYFDMCDVYIFPSFLEGSSKSIYEAMNAKMPCIVTKNSGSVIVNCEDGFIIDIADEMQIKEKMIYFKDNPEKIKFMGDRAYENVQQYSWKNYAMNVIDVYKRVNNE